MNYALGRAAQELIPEIEKYGIEIRMMDGVIIWKNSVTTVKPYTPKVVCKRLIRRYIKHAKELEARELQKNQSSLFEGVLENENR